MQEEQNVEKKQEEVKEEEKIKQVQKEIVDILEKNNLYLDVVPTYNIIFKSKINK